MAKAGRVFLAVLAGAAVWSVLWVAGTGAAQAALPEIARPDEPLTHAGLLVGYLVYSVALSLLAGYVTAAVAGARPMPAVWALALLQLALGVGFEVSYWELLPAWYHLVFLALLVPATVAGGRLRTRSGRVAMAGA